MTQERALQATGWGTFLLGAMNVADGVFDNHDAALYEGLALEMIALLTFMTLFTTSKKPQAT